MKGIEPSLSCENQILMERTILITYPIYSGFPFSRKIIRSPDAFLRYFSFYIKKLIREERIGNALNYQDTYNSLKKFKGNVTFDRITVSYLNQYKQISNIERKTLIEGLRTGCKKNNELNQILMFYNSRFYILDKRQILGKNIYAVIK